MATGCRPAAVSARLAVDWSARHTTMARLLLLSACALLAAPACQALSCYQCSDVVGTDLDHPLLHSVGAIIHKCSDFDPDDSRFKVPECQSPFDTTCAKSTIGGQEIRGCFDQTQDEGCESSDQFTLCVCKGDYCNGAGLASPALLLLPAALLARLVSG